MKSVKASIYLSILFVYLLSGCNLPTAQESVPEPSEPIVPTDVPSPTDEPTPTDLPLPTETTAPTNTSAPTDTPEPTKTALPDGVLFRDDFEGEINAGWEWQYEVAERWSVTEDGWLQIIGEPPSLLGDGMQSNLLWLSLPEGDFVVSVHLKTKPFTNFHQATIYIYEDSENYVAINRGYCDICETGGGGFFMEYKISGAWGAYQAAAKAEDVYLRLESSGDMISGYFALTEGEWERLGRFGNFFQFKRVGIGVTNAGASEDVVGLFDYFEISVP